MTITTLVFNVRIKARRFRTALKSLHYRLLMPPVVFFSLLLARLFFRVDKKPDERVILIIRSDGIGDFVLTTPFLRELRRGGPEYRIILCVREIVFDLALRCPYVDQVICLPSDITKRNEGLRKYLALLRFARNELFPLKVGIAINPRFDLDRDWIPLLQLFSGAPIRLGYTQKATREKTAHDICFDLLLTRVVPANPPIAHESIRGLDMLHALGISPLETHAELWLNRDDERAIENLLRAKQLQSNNIYAVGLFATSGKKLWPPERYQLIIRELAKKKLTCLLLGSSADAVAFQHIADDPDCRALNLAGKFSLPQIYLLLKHCRFFLGADTGLAHMAAIVSPTIVVSLHPYGGNPSSAYAPERFKPLGKQVYFLQPRNPLPPCRDECLFSIQHCIRAVAEEQVMAAVKHIV